MTPSRRTSKDTSAVAPFCRRGRRLEAVKHHNRPERGPVMPTPTQPGDMTDPPLGGPVDGHAAMIAVTLRSWTINGKPAIRKKAAIDIVARSLALQAREVYRHAQTGRGES